MKRTAEEYKRLQALESYQILETDMHAELDGLTDLASYICDTPISLITILDSSRQLTMASTGTSVEAIGREDGFCNYTIQGSDIMIVEDATRDERSKNNVFVKGFPSIRFYAGVPLTTSDGYNLGTICVLDFKPRSLDEKQKKSLRVLAKEVVARFELEKSNRELRKSDLFLKNSSDLQAIIDPDTTEYIEVNGKMLHTFDSGKDDFIGKPFGNCLANEEKRNEALNFLSKQKEDVVSFIASVETKTQTLLYLDFSFSFHQGKWYMTARDVSERYLARQELEREQKLSKKIINSLPALFFMYDRKGNIIRWNDLLLELLGYSEKEICNKDPFAHFPEEQRTLVRFGIRRIISKGIASFEADLLTKSGKLIPCIITASRFESNGETYIIGTGQVITELKKYQNKLHQSLNEKKVLLAEVHHRVKNNLAIITGLLQLESFNNKDPKFKELLNDYEMRVHSIAAVYELLYEAKNFNEFAFDKYIAELIESESKIFQSESIRFNFEFPADKVDININQAIPCALIINELITNACKHAFPDEKKGVISIKICEKDEQITLKVQDNGIGLPDTIHSGSSNSMGYTLITELVKQLDGDIQFNSEGEGTEVVIAFTRQQVKGSASTLEGIYN